MAVATPVSFFMVILALLGGGMGPGGALLSLPPLPPDPRMAAVAPADCLFYVTWAGRAVADPKSGNATEQFLAEPEIQDLVAHLVEVFGASMRREEGPWQGGVAMRELPGLLETLLTRPTAIYIRKAAPAPNGMELEAGMLVNLGKKAAATRTALASLEEMLQATAGEQLGSQTVAGVELRLIPTPPGMPSVQYGFQGDYFVVAVGEGEAERLLATAKPGAKVPGWLAEIGERAGVERPALTSYLNVRVIREIATPFLGGDPQAPTVMAALGLNNVDYLVSITGLEGEGMVTRTVVATAGQLTGLLNLLGGQGLTAADLASVPATADLAAVSRFNLADAYAQVLEAASQVMPDVRGEAARFEDHVQTEFGFRLREDLLDSLGDVWTVYNSPQEGGWLLTGLAASVTVTEPQRLERAHQRVLARVREELPGEGIEIRQTSWQGTTIYYLLAQNMPLAPSWCLTRERLLVALNPQMLKAILSRGADAKSLADLPDMAGLLKTDQSPSAILRHDPEKLLGVVYSLVQMGAPLLVQAAREEGFEFDLAALPAFPAVARHARPSRVMIWTSDRGLRIEQHQSLPLAGDLVGAAPLFMGFTYSFRSSSAIASTRSVSLNNLKMIGLGLHNYLDVFKSFPVAQEAGERLDREARPRLSWRVHILPYLEQGPLYEQFHLDEPWDSDHNRQLIPLLPDVLYNPASAHPQQSGLTSYLLPTGPGTMFERNAPRLADVTDGLSNTIMAVEAADERAVIWTQPTDFEFVAERPLDGLQDARPNGFEVLLGDGSVRFISNATDVRTLRALFTSRGGEAIGEF